MTGSDFCWALREGGDVGPVLVLEAVFLGGVVLPSVTPVAVSEVEFG